MVSRAAKATRTDSRRARLPQEGNPRTFPRRLWGGALAVSRRQTGDAVASERLYPLQARRVLRPVNLLRRGGRFKIIERTTTRIVELL